MVIDLQLLTGFPMAFIVVGFYMSLAETQSKEKKKIGYGLMGTGNIMLFAVSQMFIYKLASKK
tara:strand:- start:4058 stop:4246 length:189 start_codon:yes stop_codon:yes gene_type:complete